MNFYTSDQINSTRVVMDINGTKVYSAVYDAYGGVLNTSPFEYDPVLKFSGKERDHESELDYFGARFYDHSHYRFTSVDPILNKEEVLYNPQLWNLYSYCRNNPLTYLDPDGRTLVIAKMRGHQDTYLDHTVLDMYNKFVEACEAIGVNITSSDPDAGFRTSIEQENLRDTNELAAKISLHEAGYAFDVDWSKIPTEKNDQIVEIAKKVGLSWGGEFKKKPDKVHFYKEVPGGIKNRPKYIKEAQGIYQRSEVLNRWRNIKG